MKGFQILCDILLLNLLYGPFTGEVKALVWRAEQTVNFYSRFASVTPTRFAIPSDQEKATWHFRAVKSPDSCKEKNVSIYLQFGSLPLINPLNESFPERFFLGRSHLMLLSVLSNNVSVTHTQLLPRPGDWYTVSLIPEVETGITQKGLTVSCDYKFSASLELKELPPYIHINVNKLSQVALIDSPGDGVWVGFTVPRSSLSVELDIQDCTLESCHLQISSVSADTGQLQTFNCSNVDNVTCTWYLTTPLLGVKQFVKLQLLTPENASVAVIVRSEDCHSSDELTSDAQFCHVERKLDRYQDTGDFKTKFVRMENDTVQENKLTLSNTSVTVVPFSVERTTDIGGTLKVQVAFKRKDVAEEQDVRVCGQVMVNRFPLLNDTFDLCGNVSNGLQVNSSSGKEDESMTGSVYMPYPEEGLWTLAVGFQCYNATNNSSDTETVSCKNGSQTVTITAKIESCVDGGCNGQGSCNEYIKSADFIVFSTCVCSAGWRGYGCTDGREAFSDSSQLLEVLLLTLSNLLFLPAILLAVYRRYYLEAIVYFYNMFFSTFYHACDGDRIDKFVYCMTKYSVLATGDFLASTVSLWITLIAMAQIPMNISSAVQMAGPLALIIGVLLDRHSLWVIAVPTGVGLLVVAASWGRQCCRSKRCFPEKRRYLWMLPGVLFAVLGAVMFAFFETTKNYKYIHSAWHVCLSLSIVFLLPPRRKQTVVTSVNLDDTESTEGLVLGPNNYTRRMNFEL